MDNQEITMTDAKIFIPLFEKAISLDTTSDYTIPEYQPEAKRILHVSGEAIQPATYVSSTSAEFDGKLECLVFYVGIDDEIYSTPITLEYNFEAPFDHPQFIDSDAVNKAYADVFTESITSRLTGPRKINVKGRLKAHARVYCVTSPSALSPKNIDINSMEVLPENIPSASFSHSISDTVELSEEIIPDDENVRVIGTDSCVFIHSISPNSNKAEITGEIILRLLTCNDENTSKINVIERKIPLNTVIELNGMNSNSKCTAYATLNDLTVNMLDGRIICDMVLCVSVNALNSETFAYIKDLYSTRNECEVTNKSYTVLQDGYCVNGNFSMNEKLLKESIKLPENSNIVCIFGSANADEVSCNGSKNVVTAQVKYTLILENDGEYTSTDVMLPARYEFICDNAEDTTPYVNVSVISCKARQDAESISIDAELSVNALGTKCVEINTVHDVTIGGELIKGKRDLVIHYLCPDDTPWSIAKKHHVSLDELTRKNSKLDNIEYAII